MTLEQVETIEAPATGESPKAPKRRKKSWTWLRWTVVALGGLAMFFPFLWMVSTSLSSDANVFALPPNLAEFELSSYRRIIDRFPVDLWIINSLGVAFVATALQVGTGAMAAYAFARLSFKGRDILFAAYLATLMIPFQVLIVPLFIEARYLGVLDSYIGLLLPSIAWPFGMFLFRQSFSSLPIELEEAAFVDGASHWTVFRRIIIPLSKPVLATGAVLSFMGNWNSFLWPLVVISSENLMTLPLGLSTLQGRFVTEHNLILAGATISVLPIVAVYLFVQRYIIEGVASTGIKG